VKCKNTAVQAPSSSRCLFSLPKPLCAVVLASEFDEPVRVEEQRLGTSKSRHVLLSESPLEVAVRAI